jgi:hydrogenase small subunit
MSCDGCSIAVTGATNPSVEDLLTGALPGLPRIVLHHPVLDVDAGERFVAWYERAARGELGAPYVVIYEGSVPDEEVAAETGGYWSGMGVREVGGTRQPMPTAEWLRRRERRRSSPSAPVPPGEGSRRPSGTQPGR